MGIAGSKLRNGSGDRGPTRRPPAVGGADPIELHFKIPSDHSRQRDVQNTILEAIAKHGFSGQSTFAIKLALEEALINAIKHGNRLDRKKHVLVDAKVTPGMVEISVEDEGPGFDRSSVPDPTEEVNLEKCSGRGILLMESYMTSVSWSNGGRRVKLTKKNVADAKSA